MQSKELGNKGPNPVEGNLGIRKRDGRLDTIWAERRGYLDKPNLPIEMSSCYSHWIWPASHQGFGAANVGTLRMVVSDVVYLGNKIVVVVS